MWNRPDVLAAEMPSSNGVGSARALARLYAALVGEVDGIRVLAPETVEAACVVQAEGPDRVLFLPSRFGLGFMLQPMLRARRRRRAPSAIRARAARSASPTRRRGSASAT